MVGRALTHVGSYVGTGHRQVIPWNIGTGQGVTVSLVPTLLFLTLYDTEWRQETFEGGGSPIGVS